MTTKNDPLHSIQARIEELQNAIAEKEEQIKKRTSRLKDDLEAELSPVQIVRKHPLQAVGATFFIGFLFTRALSVRRKRSSTPLLPKPFASSECSRPQQGESALYTIGVDVLRSAKDLGFSYLQRYIDKKIK